MNTQFQGLSGGKMQSFNQKGFGKCLILGLLLIQVSACSRVAISSMNGSSQQSVGAQGDCSTLCGADDPNLPPKDSASKNPDSNPPSSPTPKNPSHNDDTYLPPESTDQFNASCEKNDLTTYNQFQTLKNETSFFAQDIHGNYRIESPQIDNLLNFSGWFKMTSAKIISVQNGWGAIVAESKEIGQLLDIRGNLCVRAESIVHLQNIKGSAIVIGKSESQKMEVQEILDVQGHLKLINVHVSRLRNVKGSVELINSTVDRRD